MATSAGEIEVKLSLEADDFRTAIEGSQTAVRTFGGELDKTLSPQMASSTASMAGLTNVSRGMESQFSHRFQHIGLMLFAGDALRASGLGAETRQIINGLNTALMAGEAAFGAAAGPAILLVAALTAVAAIALKVAEKHKDMTEELEKLRDATREQIGLTDNEIAALKSWQTAVGNLTPALEKLLDSEMKLRAEQILSQEVTNQQLIASLNLRIAKEKDVQQALEQTIAEEKKHLVSLAALKPGMEGYTMAEREIAKLEDATKKLGATSLKVATDEAQLNKIIAQQIDLHKGVTASISDQAAAAVKAAEEGKKATEAQMKGEVDAIDHAEEAEKKSMDNRIAYWIKTHKEMTKTQDQELAKQEHAVNLVVGRIGSDFGDAFAKMAIEGTSFTDSMKKAFTNMAEQVIAQIVKMIVEWEIFTALTGMGGPAGTFGMAGLKSIGMMASGGMINEPSIITGLRSGRKILAGESGPEMVTPMGQNMTAAEMGSIPGSGGGSITVNITGQFIEGDANSWNRLMREKIIPQIRRFTMSSPTGPFNRTRGVV